MRDVKLIQHSTHAPQSVINLLKNTQIGTSGTLYQLLDTEEKISKLDNPHFYWIERNQKAVGTVTVCSRQVSWGDQIKNGLYIRYFAFDSIFRGSTDNTRTRNSVFEKEWRTIFETGKLSVADSQIQPDFFWAYIDPQNLRSFRMNERFGFKTIASFETIAYSRFRPSKSKNVSRLIEKDQAAVRRILQAFYRNFLLFSEAHLFESNNFFVLKKNEKIVAGIQVNPARIKLVSLPGKLGRLKLKMLPKVPFINRILNPSEHKFLATEGLFWLDGYEKEVNELLEGVLHEMNHHSLLLWEDKKSTRFKNLPLKWGMLQRIKNSNEVHVIFKAVKNAEINEDLIPDAPVYLSGFDVT